jgi:hypothetical protein
MAEAVTGVGGSQAIPASVDLNNGRAASVRLSFTGLSSVVGRGVVIGSAAAPPATYSAITVLLTIGELVDYSPPTRVALTPGGGESVSFGIDNMGVTGVPSGHHLYACLFPTTTPSGGTAPSLVCDLGEVF